MCVLLAGLDQLALIVSPFKMTLKMCYFRSVFLIPDKLTGQLTLTLLSLSTGSQQPFIPLGILCSFACTKAFVKCQEKERTNSFWKEAEH